MGVEKSLPLLLRHYAKDSASPVLGEGLGQSERRVSKSKGPAASIANRNLHTSSGAGHRRAHAQAPVGGASDSGPAQPRALPLPTGGGAVAPAGNPGQLVPLVAADRMAGVGKLALRPWIRQLILGSEALSSPRSVQLLEVLEEAEAPGPSHASYSSDVGATLLLSDGTHSIRCLLMRETLDTLNWEEKEFGFRGLEGRLLLLRDCRVRVQVAEGGAPAEFYLQVDRFSLLPIEQLPVLVTDCNQDVDVQKKLYDCLEEHLSEATPPRAGLSLSQLLDEVYEDQEHREALVCLAESCLMLAGPGTAPPLTHWATSCCRATGEDVYTVPSLLLHISENDQLILNSLGPGQRAQGPELPPPDPAVQDFSLTLMSSSSPSSSGTPALPSHGLSEESGASISFLPALPLAGPDSVQKDSFQPQPAPGSLPPSSPHPSGTPNSPLRNCTPSLLPHGHIPNPHQARVTRPQKPALEFKELALIPKNQQLSPRTRTTKRVQEACPVWDPPKKHRDGSAFQYEYEPPCTSLCAQVQAARLPPQLMAWALHFLMEPQLESELTQV
ncbi:LOW QUALITY PROTEIN: adrenocortical dysplasia protein homolog [Carlito syrichta]|uniref:LOW QUALITY PROTEIN: adrenocortical dysplasia protein homolog n=1 Tax=Carlito syrichta TaxID=1868482 RepID=A0A1U7U1J8_CARSF|nr:LOW QUALITY PROTEIN: adrenocortical dysplasia protein homolog [Carlito syrichta]